MPIVEACPNFVFVRFVYLTDIELQKVLNAIKYIPSENERDEVTQIILKAASESITLDRLKQLTKREEKADFKENGTNGFIKFTKKEINSMPDYLKKLFTINDNIAYAEKSFAVNRFGTGKSD